MARGPATEPPAKGTGGKNGGKDVLRLRFSSLLMLIFLAVVGIALAYIGGVMTGRRVELEAAAQMTGTGSPATGAPQHNATDSPIQESPGRILTPQELEFARVLRGEAPRPATPVEPVKSAPESGAMAPPDTSETAQPEKENAGAVKSVENNDTLYDYVFQMGAFRDESAADILRQNLEGHGFRTGLERGGKVYVVTVKMRGNPDRVEELNQIAAQLRLGQPLMRSRKPAAGN